MRLDRELTCAEVVEVITDYLDGRMPARDRERFEEHLAFCDGCSAYLEQMRLTIAVTGRLRVEDVPEPLEERLLAAFRAWKTA
jgi:anti-sigma factor (TIGR02949 family)